MQGIRLYENQHGEAEHGAAGAEHTGSLSGCSRHAGGIHGNQGGRAGGICAPDEAGQGSGAQAHPRIRGHAVCRSVRPVAPTPGRHDGLVRTGRGPRDGTEKRRIPGLLRPPPGGNGRTHPHGPPARARCLARRHVRPLRRRLPQPRRSRSAQTRRFPGTHPPGRRGTVQGLTRHTATRHRTRPRTPARAVSFWVHPALLPRHRHRSQALSSCSKLIIIILPVILEMFFPVRRGSVAGYTTDETGKNSPKERARG